MLRNTFITCQLFCDAWQPVSSSSRSYMRYFFPSEKGLKQIELAIIWKEIQAPRITYYGSADLSLIIHVKVERLMRHCSLREWNWKVYYVIYFIVFIFPCSMIISTNTLGRALQIAVYLIPRTSLQCRSEKV